MCTTGNYSQHCNGKKKTLKLFIYKNESFCCIPLAWHWKIDYTLIKVVIKSSYSFLSFFSCHSAYFVSVLFFQVLF